ncbi:hypothetical protein MKW94_024077 [Papaver nudicaule]|uniref:Uncharacterized protein n=1 Tax=Papaver nudicaule TaxID=74823 RepID=A0AA41S827_PAPNU|nr:hypothetical protein [Papaver nudicaule]
MIKVTRISTKDGTGTEELLNVHDYIRVDNPEVLRKALASGADKDEKDSVGRTPLHNACSLGKVCITLRRYVLWISSAAVDSENNVGEKCAVDSICCIR